MLPPKAGKHHVLDPILLERYRAPSLFPLQTRMMLERISSGPIGFEQRLFECRSR
jgi:hypothetical protein